MAIDRELTFFGHTKSDYENMFMLQDLDVKDMRILDCFGGFSTFVSEMRAEGHNVVGIDPIYKLGAAALKEKLSEYSNMLKNNLEQQQPNYNWDVDNNPQTELSKRTKAAEQFIFDLPKGIEDGYYFAEDFPHIKFRDEAFDLTLCSHFLFTQDDKFSLDFHVECLLELVRISDEVRVYPLVGDSGAYSPHLGPVLKALQQQKYNVELRQANYEFQKGANALLIIDKNACEVSAHQEQNIQEHSS